MTDMTDAQRACRVCNEQFAPSPWMFRKRDWRCLSCRRSADSGKVRHRVLRERQCIDCKQPLVSTRSRCNACRRSWEKAWRLRRKAAGRPVRSGAHSPDYYAKQKATYLARPEIRARLNAQMRERCKSPHYRERNKARRMLRTALETGRIERLPCERCGHSPAQGHHDDYSKPFDVRWLCAKHHAAHHKSAAAEAAGIKE